MNPRNIELNFFTNVVHEDVERIPIFQTIDSVHKTFDLKSFSGYRVYMHPHPFATSAPKYKEMLRDFFQRKGLKVEIVTTESLWDGYVKSIRAAEAPFVLQMEHDWIFMRRCIRHSADEITALMEIENLPYLRFNKRKNGIVTGMIQEVEERKVGDFAYCRDNVMSNNPHFIRTSFYKEVALPLLLRNSGTGSLGIERELTAEIGQGASYGPLGYPKTIRHLNGKKIYLKSQMDLSEKIAYRLKRLDTFGKKYLPGLKRTPAE